LFAALVIVYKNTFAGIFTHGPPKANRFHLLNRARPKRFDSFNVYENICIISAKKIDAVFSQPSHHRWVCSTPPNQLSVLFQVPGRSLLTTFPSHQLVSGFGNVCYSRPVDCADAAKPFNTSADARINFLNVVCLGFV
jgi:hypothetical protein